MGDDEPSLGWLPTLNQASRQRLDGSDDLDQGDADRESSLGLGSVTRRPTATGVTRRRGAPMGDRREMPKVIASRTLARSLASGLRGR